MNEWNGTGDQFIADTESVYPEFSDIHARYLSCPERPVPRHYHQPEPKCIGNYEDKYQYEQQNVPAYLGCRCNACAMAHLRPTARPPMRRQTVDERQRDNTALWTPLFTGGVPITSRLNIGPAESGNDILLMFMFVLFVFICCCCMQVAQKIVAQLTAGANIIK